MEKIDYTNLNTEEFLKEQRNRDELFAAIAKNINDKNFDHEDVQMYVSNLYDWMNKFYDCSFSMFKGLAEVYEMNSEFSEVLSKNYGKDMPSYLSKAIIYFCDKNNK